MQNLGEKFSKTHHGTTRVIVMLGARMKKVPMGIKSQWEFPLINERYGRKFGNLPVKVSGGDSRMKAIGIIYKDYLKSKKPNESLIIFTTGGREKSGHSRSHQAYYKLIEKYNLPKSIVKSLGGIGSTLGNANTFFKFVKQNKNQFSNVKEIEIVTNDHHIIRAWTMFIFKAYKFSTKKYLKIKDKDISRIKNILNESLNKLGSQSALKEVIDIINPYLKNLKLKIKPVIAEKIIASSNASGKRYAQNIIKNKWVQETRKFENKGIADFLAGKYKS